MTMPWVVMAISSLLDCPGALTAGSELDHEVSWAKNGSSGDLGFGGCVNYVSRRSRALLPAWLWRLVLFFLLLKRIARLDLAIVPTHPDGAGGWRFMERFPKAFSLFAFAVSAVLASRRPLGSTITESMFSP